MTKHTFTILAFFAMTLFMYTANAQQGIQLPQPSPTAKIVQTVGLSTVTVDYSRPGAKGRDLFGSLIPYDQVWRTGANASTKITLSDDFTFEGEKVPAGTYALYTIPSKDKWVIIIHKNTELWGAGGYNDENDLFRLTVDAKESKEFYETFTIEFSNLGFADAMIDIKWGNSVASFKIATEVDSKVMAQINDKVINANGEVDPGMYAAAANYYLMADKDMNQAIEWIDKAIAANPDAFWLMHNKAKMQAKTGDYKGAIATAEKSMEIAKKNPDGDFGYIKNNEDAIAKWKEM
ncbi:DUF2911 domain-containing protein [Marinigracilibium pacificum]|uniref:DUF2911 domain-containing protein n=1 Tax=Marinigracilibium pacificum TaxID=2729599 RepID=A0A848IZ05_9BACT|nr:DUF2911 domain-containing protein [Marinigracilibium pacificum]NMM48388.1 DUF2911 domain-containing protein [Marinigracilibium pacificum]